MRNAYFQYYETFEHIAEKIRDIEEREHFRKTVINYGLYGTEPAGMSEIEEIAWAVCKDLIDQQRNRRQKNAENRKAAEPAKPEKAARETVKKFIPPTAADVEKYCAETGKKINVNAFISWYESNGWKVGKSKTQMRNWKAAVTSWYERDKERNGGRADPDSNGENYEEYFK